MSKVKICFMSLNAYSLFNKSSGTSFGGAELQSYLLANELAKDPNYQISFIVGNHDGQAVEQYGSISVYKLKYSQSGNAMSRQLSFATGLWKLLKLVNADFYQQRAAGASAGIIAYFCKKYQKKFIYMTASEAELKGGLRKRSFLEGKLFYYGLKRADLILTQNVSHQEALKNTFKKESVVFKNVMKLPNRQDSKDRETVLWIASSQPLKQPEIFLELAQDFPNEKFVMIMPMHQHNQSLFNQISEQAKSIPNVTFIEKVPFEETTKYYNQAKVFVNTSKFEGFPNTFVQAAASATPMLSLNVNPDDFLTKEKCGLFSNNSYDKLVENLHRLLTNQDEWQEFSDNAYGYAKANHDIITNVNKYKALIGAIRNSSN